MIKLQKTRRISENIAKSESVLELWRLRNLTFKRRITIFKILALSKIIDFALVKTIPNEIIDQLSKMERYFIWNKMKPKIKKSTLYNNFQDDGLKNLDIR